MTLQNTNTLVMKNVFPIFSLFLLVFLHFFLMISLHTFLLSRFLFLLLFLLFLFLVFLYRLFRFPPDSNGFIVRGTSKETTRIRDNSNSNLPSREKRQQLVTSECPLNTLNSRGVFSSSSFSLEKMGSVDHRSTFESRIMKDHANCSPPPAVAIMGSVG